MNSNTISVSIDTVHISITDMYMEVKDLWANDWWYDPDAKAAVFRKNVTAAHGANVHFDFYPASQSLVVQFSAPKVLYGTNAIAYDSNQYEMVEQEIVDLVVNETGFWVHPSQMLVARVDLPRNFVFEREDEAEMVMGFAKKILPYRNEVRKDYKNGFTSLSKKGNGFRVYYKHKEAKELALPPTVRFEFQMRRRCLTKMFGYRPTLRQILTASPDELAKVWDALMSRYHLDEKIVSRKELGRIAKTLTPAQRETLYRMNDCPSFTDKRERRKQQAIIRIMRRLGFCAYSCELPLTMIFDVCDLIMTTEKRMKKCYTANYSRTCIPQAASRDIPQRKWYLDSS